MTVWRVDVGPPPDPEAEDAEADRERRSADREEPEQVAVIDMLNNLFTNHAFVLSHDGRKLVVHREQALEVHASGRMTRLDMDLRANNPRSFYWNPDNRRALFLAPVTSEHPNKRVAVMDIYDLQGEPPYEIAYEAPPDRLPFGVGWAPDGNAFYVIERVYEGATAFTAIRRVQLEPERSETEIARMLGLIEWFTGPDSRYEDGSGPSEEPFRILFGAMDGLYVTDPFGKRKRRVSTLPAVGLNNVEWHPTPGHELALLYFESPVRDAEGRVLKGTYLADLAPDAEEPVVQLDGEGDVHTLWFSPKGTYASWAAAEGVWFQRADDALGSAATHLRFVDEEGGHLECHGMAWSKDESRLAVAAGDRLYVYDVATGESEVAHRFEAEGELFTAEPAWSSPGEVVLTTVEDVRNEMWRRRNTPECDLPLKGVEPDGEGADR